MNNRDYLIDKFGGKKRVKVPMTREGIYYLYRELGYRVGVEVGVYLGENAVKIALNNPKGKLYLVDAYSRECWDKNANYKYPVAYAFRRARHRMRKVHQKYNYDYKFVRKLSSEAVKKFKDNSIDYVYIDANHSFEHCYEDISLWSRKVRIGGMISGHDYDRYSMNHFAGVVEAVLKFTKNHNIKPLYITMDKPNSYFWIKRKDYA